MLYWFGKIFVGPFFYLLFRPKVLNRKRLRTRGAAIYVCNHFSLADPIALAAICPRTIHFMAKESLFSSALKRFFFWSIFVFSAGGENAHIGSIKKAMALLEEKKAFGIFPEGHRSAVITEMDAMEKGAAFIALKTNAPIVPVYIDPLSWKRFRLRAAVGETIYPDQVQRACPDQKGPEALTEYITDTLVTLRDQVEAMSSLKELQP